MQNLLDNYENQTSKTKGISYISLYLYAYQETNNSKYLKIAEMSAMNLSAVNYVCGPPNEWQCPDTYEYYQGRIIRTYASLYETTGNQEFLNRAVKFAQAGSPDCGP